jgi:hypothetical protein
MPLVSAPWSLDGVRPAIRRGAPRLGEDDVAVAAGVWPAMPGGADPTADASGRSSQQG